MLLISIFDYLCPLTYPLFWEYRFIFFYFMFTNVILYPVYLFLSAFSHFWVKFTVNLIHFNHQHLGSLELNSHPYVQSLGSLLFHSISHCFGEAQYLLILVKQFKLTINCSLCTRLYDTETFIRPDFYFISHNYLHAPPHMLKPYSLDDTCMKIVHKKKLQNCSWGEEKNTLKFIAERKVT